MNADYQRLVDKARELTDMLEALANKKLAQGRDEEAATLTAIRMNVASLVVFDVVTERSVGGPVTTGSLYLVGIDGPEIFTPKANGTIVPNEKPRRRPKSEPPDDPTPEGVPAV